MAILDKKHNKFLSTVWLAVSVSLLLYGCGGNDYADHGQAARYAKNPAKVSGRDILHTAKGQLGLKYLFGGISPRTGFDCSGFVMWVHKSSGINIAREAPDQFRRGKKIKKSNLRAGDIVFFETYKPGPSHVGIYDGKGSFIHSPNSKSRVKYTKLSNSYYKKRYLGARRYW